MPPASAASAEPAEPECATYTPVPDGYFYDPDTDALKLCPTGYSGIPRTKSHQQCMAQLNADYAARDARRAAERAAAPPEPPTPAALPAQDVMPTSAASVSAHAADGLAVMRDWVQRLRAAAIREKNGVAWGRYHRENKRLAEQERRMIARAAHQNAPPYMP